MGISNSEFDDFTKQLISVMNASGVTLADQATVQTILETTRTLIVVPQGAQPPPTTTGSTPVTTGGPSSTTGTPTTGTPTTGTPTTGTPTTGTPTTGTPSTPTFCNKYATAKQLTQQQLVAAVIDGVVQILVAPGSVNLKYFNGTQPAGSLNFLLPTSAAALSNLKLHLVAFFGQMGVLGCDDPTFPRYTGQTLQQIHAPMGITQSDNDAFTAAVLATLMSAGVTSQTDLNAVSSLLTQFLLKSLVAVVLALPHQALFLDLPRGKLVSSLLLVLQLSLLSSSSLSAASNAEKEKPVTTLPSKYPVILGIMITK